MIPLRNIVTHPFSIVGLRDPYWQKLNTAHSRFQYAQMYEWLNAMVAEVMAVFKFKRHFCLISVLSNWAADFHPDVTQSALSVQSTFLLKLADVVGVSQVFLSLFCCLALFIQAKSSCTADYDVHAVRDSFALSKCQEFTYTVTIRAQVTQERFLRNIDSDYKMCM